ncbi:Valine-trna ligase [Globisporangium polare]
MRIMEPGHTLSLEALSLETPRNADALTSSVSALSSPAASSSSSSASPPPPPLHSDSFIKRPLHALVYSKNRSHTSPHLMQHQDQTLFPVSDSLAQRRRHHDAANFEHVRFAAGRMLPARKAASFSEGVEPATAERMADTDVFLGGSCNPTTWRRDVAIPLLEDAHVKYFNPQVDDWYEELIQIETRAKETAKVVFMVIDNATRSMVCINESVEYICRGRRVVLVVDDILPGTLVEGSEVTAEEIADLNGARECLRNLAIKKEIRMYDNVREAVLGTIRWVREDNLTTYIPEVPRLRKRSSIVLNKWSGQIRPRRNTSRSASSTAVLSVVSQKSLEAENGHPNGSPLQTSSSSGQLSSESIVQHLGCKLYGSYTGGSVYLGGNVGATSWREKVAVPLLQKAGIPFYIPYLDYLTFELSRQPGSPKVSSRTDRWKEIDAEKDRAELILFVIPKQVRSIAAMTEAVELVASWHAMLLVIEPLEDGCIVSRDGSVIVGREFKDLARARAYLQEMAERNDVEVFASVAEAVESIIERL